MIKLKDYIISISDQKEGNYTLTSLPEDLCMEMCYFEDHGPRWSPSSRFIYWTKYADTDKGIHFGTARAAVQYVIIKKLKYKKGMFIKIEYEKDKSLYNQK